MNLKKIRVINSNLLIITIIVVLAIVSGVLIGRNISDESASDMSLITLDDINIVSILGDEWEIDKRPIYRSLRDIKGETPTLVDNSHIMATYRDRTQFINIPFVQISVFTYTNSTNARERYFIQEQTLFYEFIDRPNRFSRIDRSSEFELNTDQYRIMCRDSESESVGEEYNCTGILRYGNYIVVANIWLERTSIQVITDEQLYEIFDIIDENLSSMDT